MRYISMFGLVCVCLCAGWVGGRFGTLECDNLKVKGHIEVGESIVVGNKDYRVSICASPKSKYAGIQVQHDIVGQNPELVNMYIWRGMPWSEGPAIALNSGKKIAHDLCFTIDNKYEDDGKWLHDYYPNTQLIKNTDDVEQINLNTLFKVGEK